MPYRLFRNNLLRVKCARLLAASLASLLIATANANENAADPELRALLAEAINNTDSFPDRFEAEVWLKDMSNRLSPIVPDNQERIDILTRVHQEATRVDLPPELILAVIDIESRFDRYAISRAGARGLMQVMPFWLEELNRPNDNLFQIEINLRMGCTILKHYIDKEDGNMTQALARYNGSYGKTWYSEKVLGRLSTQWFRN